MGRVDEAMRKAAETTGTVRRPDVSTSDAYLAEVKAIRPEGFPSEASESAPRRRRAAGQDVHARTGVQPTAALAERMLPKLAKRIVVDETIDPVSREQYRRLSTGLHAAQATNGLKVIAISSALAGEGKSLTASNLALTLSESYQRSVLLIDGDLRRPSISEVFGLPSGKGLSDSVVASHDAAPDVHQVTPHLSVLTSGRANVDPVAVLSSARLRQIIEEARDAFDWVLIDTPPVGLLSDANLIADLADGTLLVVKAAATPYDVVQRAVATLGRDRLLGVILNQAADAGPASKYHGYYYTASGPQ